MTSYPAVVRLDINSGGVSADTYVIMKTTTSRLKPLDRFRNRLGSDAGFTLPEAMMALTILAIVLGIMAAGLAAGMKGLQRAKIEAVMSNFAQAKVEEVRSLNYEDVGYPTGTPRGVIDPGNYDIEIQGVNMNVDIFVQYVGSSTGLDVVDDPTTPGPDGDGAEAAYDFGVDYKEVVVTLSHDLGLIDDIVTRTIVAPPNIGAHEGIANVIVNLGPYEPFAAADPLVYPYPKVCLDRPSTFYISSTTDATQVFPGIDPNPDTGPEFWYDLTLGLGCTVQDPFSQWHILPNDIVNGTARVHAPVTTTVDTFLGIYLPASIDVRALDSGTGLPITTSAKLVLDATKPHQFNSATGLWSVSSLDGYPMVPDIYDVVILASGYLPAVIPARNIPQGYPADRTDNLDVILTPAVTTEILFTIQSSSGRPINGAQVTVSGGPLTTPINLISDGNGQVTAWLPEGAVVEASVNSPYGHSSISSPPGGETVPPSNPAPGPDWLVNHNLPYDSSTKGFVNFNKSGAGDFGYRPIDASEAYNVVLANNLGEATAALAPGTYQMVKLCDDGRIINIQSITVTTGGTKTYGNSGGQC